MESADREPIVQAASQAWIVIGFAPIPDRPVRHDQINQATRERCGRVCSLAGLRAFADVVGIEAGTVVDEMADTGETLRLVAERVRELGAREVTTAALVSHSWADPAPDLSALVSDALVMFPWDQRVLVDGKWQLHPELVQALAEQSGPPAA